MPSSSIPRPPLSRAANLALWLTCLALPGCAGLGPVRESFAPIGDLVTTRPRSNAERGFGEQVEAPLGLSWSLQLDGVHATKRERPHFAMSLAIRDTLRTGDEEPRGIPDFSRAQLVDDSGMRFGCERGLVPDRSEAKPAREGDPAEGVFTMLFDLPQDYRFASVFGMTVHWQLHVDDGQVLPISSRFRR